MTLNELNPRWCTLMRWSDQAPTFLIGVSFLLVRVAYLKSVLCAKVKDLF